MTPSQFGFAPPPFADLQTHGHSSPSGITSISSDGSGSTSNSSASGSSSTLRFSGSTPSLGSDSSDSALATALQTLRDDINTIELASGTTVGELTALQDAFRTLANDGLTPSSRSDLASFENSLVAAYASGTTLSGNATLLAQFEALFTDSPTDQETIDLTAAYEALAAAVTSSGITSQDLATIDADWEAVQSAIGGSSTSSFPYFALVTGQGGGGFGGGFGFALGGDPRGMHGPGSDSSDSDAATALQTLHDDIETIELASGTTVGELTAIRDAFHTFANDGLTPSSPSDLAEFENKLVTAYASGTTLSGNTTLLSEFEALFTESPTDQETADLTAAYEALAAAVTSSGITSQDLATIDADWAAVQAAFDSTGTSTFPYFTLVTGQQGGGRGGFGRGRAF